MLLPPKSSVICHAKGHITCRCPQRALVIEFEDDILLEDVDELLVIDPLKLNYEDDSFVMYDNDFLLDGNQVYVMRWMFSTPSDNDACK